jgi:GNAT superfamily N-acetyltransferase
MSLDGLVIRRASEGDLLTIIELNAEGNDESAAEEPRHALGVQALTSRDFAVALDGQRVVSTVGLLSVRLHLGDVAIPTGQPEFIATHPGYRNRGLIRALLDVVHSWSAQRGDLVQIIAGIPYFYRQFGYQYGIPLPRQRLVPPDADLGKPGPWETRPATLADIAAMRQLQDFVQARADLRLPYAEEIWRVLIGLSHAELAVAMRDGVIHGVGRIRAGEGRPVGIRGVAADCPGAARALLLRARQAHPTSSLLVADRTESSISAVLAEGSFPVAEKQEWLYVRIPDPVALLTHLRPVLTARLEASCFSGYSGDVVISLYRSALRMTLERGRLAKVSHTPRAQSPVSQTVSFLPPDLMARVAFGPHGVLGSEDHPDVNLGRQRALMGVLFPPVRVDVLTW